MHLSDETVGKREPYRETPHAVLKRSHVVGGLNNIVKGHAGRFLQFKQQ